MKVTVKDSPIHGKGVFALEDIPAEGKQFVANTLLKIIEMKAKKAGKAARMYKSKAAK